MFDRSMIETLLPSGTTSHVAHYTRIGTLCHFIPSGQSGWASAWATPVQFLNDRMELTLGLETLRRAAQQPLLRPKIASIVENLLASAGRLETDPFQMSFSGNPDEIGQWRGYAANGMGCAIVTDAVALHQVADVAGWVIYDRTEQRIFAENIISKLSHETDDDLIEQVLIASASYIKHEGFKPEMEFRLLKFPQWDEVRFRESGDRLVPYVDYLQGKTPLPIRRVIIGPGWQLSSLKSAELTRNHVVQGISRLLQARGLHLVVSPESSSIPYDPK